MFDINKIKGAFATIITPFTNEDNNVNYPELEKEIEFLCNSPITGLFPLASTSEFPFMSFETKKQYLKTVAEANKGRKAMLAGCCGIDFTETMKLLELASEYGYDAAVVCPPYYFPQSGDEEFRYYTQLADNPYGMKIIMYNIHFFTSEIPLTTVARLIQNPNIVGIKDSSGNMKRIRHTVEYASERDDFVVYCGTDEIILPALVSGAQGSMTALGALLPEVVMEIYKGFNAGDLKMAKLAQDSFIKLCRAADTLPFPVGYKMIAQLRGMKIGHIQQFCATDAIQAAWTIEKEQMKKLLNDFDCGDKVM